jgi:YHS domain-containing protein
MDMSVQPGLLPVRALHFVALCGRIFINADPQYFPRAEYRGRTIYFCTDSCLGAFLADPERFYKAHRNSNHEEPRASK